MNKASTQLTFRSDLSISLRGLPAYLRLRIQRNHLRLQIVCSLVEHWLQDLHTHCNAWESRIFYVCVQMKLANQILNFLIYSRTKISL